MAAVRRTALLLVVAVVLVAGFVIWNRSSGDDAAGKPPSGAIATGGTVDDVATKLLAEPKLTPIASVTATIPTLAGSSSSTAEILSLVAGPTSTVLQWRWTTVDDGQHLESDLSTRLSGIHPGGDTEGISVVSKQSNQKLFPAGYLQEGAWQCTCSDLPTELGPDGVLLSATFAPLGSEATEVELNIPGFPAVTVPVSRA